MTKGRLEAFSDGVIAIIITIMVLKMKVPYGDRLEDLVPLVPMFFSYVAAPAALYGAVLLMAAIAYLVLQQAIIRAQGHDSILKKAVGRDWKGKLSSVLYVVAILATSRATWIAQATFVLAALIWLIPDRRIEKLVGRGSAD